MKSVLTLKKRLSLSDCSKMARRMGTRYRRYRANIKTMAVSKPVYWAMTVPNATPVTPMWNTFTNSTLNPMLTTLIKMAMTMGMVVFCMPIYQPLKV